MLVLMRKIGEEIRIGSDMTVRVLTVSGQRVKLGVSGPREVLVMRAEICRDKGVPEAVAATPPSASMSPPMAQKTPACV